MELVFLAVGFIAGVFAMGATLRRAKQNPDGRSAKFIAMFFP